MQASSGRRWTLARSLMLRTICSTQCSRRFIIALRQYGNCYTNVCNFAVWDIHLLLAHYVSIATVNPHCVRRMGERQLVLALIYINFLRFILSLSLSHPLHVHIHCKLLMFIFIFCKTERESGHGKNRMCSTVKALHNIATANNSKYSLIYRWRRTVVNICSLTLNVRVYPHLQ